MSRPDLTTAATDLATWLRVRTPQQPDELTHLKVQKLMFYAYGAATVYGHDDELGCIEFEPWKHGPVNREVWTELREFGGAALPPTSEQPPVYSRGLDQMLSDVVNVYGRMAAWDLRQETHLEQPWCDAYAQRMSAIPDEAIRDHFAQKFGGDVSYPEYLVRRSNIEIDGLSMRRFPSLRALSRYVSLMFGPAPVAF